MHAAAAASAAVGDGSSSTRAARGLSARLDANGALSVDDDGPGLPPESYEHVFGVGERLDERMPGHGLGLSIVKDLVGLYEGQVALDAAPLGGLRLTLAFRTIG